MKYNFRCRTQDSSKSSWRSSLKDREEKEGSSLKDREEKGGSPFGARKRSPFGTGKRSSFILP